ncbi:MAG: hypothetical protein Q7U53_19395 [Anaerolineaceae bacterium]|nr:hypothetical protein [Anaerolineaceae bacterium]
MDRLNTTLWDEYMEDALRNEPLSALPVDFSMLVLQQISMEEKPRFRLISWLDLLISLVVAFAIGIVFLIPFLLPEQLSPWMQWVLQWGGYLLTKAVFNLPGIFLSFGVVLFAIGALIAGVKGMQGLMRHAQEKRNLFSLL